ncbi:MAG: tyrosine-type recombinase/integrase [Limisphaerales bacterium]
MDSASPDAPALSQDLSSGALRALAEAAEALLRFVSAAGGKAPAVSTLVRFPVHPADGPTVSDAVNQLITTKARIACSDRYLRQLRVSLGAFARGRGRRPLAEVTADELERWLASSRWAVRTRRGCLADVRTLFTWAQRRGYVDRNPAAAVELPGPQDVRGIEVHTPDQVRAVLKCAYARMPDAGRHLAIRYFAGLRSAEAHRLGEEDLLLEQGLIQVPAHKAKTRQRRLVPIQPNLAAWLALGGELRPMSPNRIREIVRAAGTGWPQNVTRHSFVSYRLAATDNAAKTALEAGHAEAILFRHYRAIVSPAAAAAYWALRPDHQGAAWLYKGVPSGIAVQYPRPRAPGSA